MLTNQHVFDTVVNALRKQGCQALNNDGCAYRGANNTKCAAGHIMPDHLYDSSFEGRSISTLLETYNIERLFGDQVEDINLIFELQSTHDEGAIDWEFKWEKIAIDFNLKYSQPEKEENAVATAN